MSSEQIRLLESIRDGIDLLGDKLGGRIDETNARVGSVERQLETTNQCIGNVERQLETTNQRMGNVERQLETTNQRLDSITGILSANYTSLSVRGDATDQRMNALEQRVTKLEQAS